MKIRFREDKEDKENKGENEGMDRLKGLLSTGLYFLAVLGLTLFVIAFVGQRTEVSGSSMESTLQDGDNLIVDKISYRFRDPQRFEIIVFPFQYQDDTYYIKRIIGLPGERVRIDEDGNIFINDELLEEHFGREVIRNPGVAFDGVTLKDDEYFVLGDNRNNSSDSRSPQVGNIHKSKIIGRAWLRIFPFNKITFLAGK